MDINTDFIDWGEHFIYNGDKLLVRAYFYYFLAKVIAKLINH